MKDNRVKVALRAGHRVIGAELSQIPDAIVPKIFAAAGFDFVFLDMEHTPFSLETIADLIASARAADIVPIVRIPQAEYVWISRVLDAGAQGIVVPRVNTVQQVRDIVSWVHYPPRGIRGFACTAGQTDGTSPDLDEFLETQRTQILIAIQIERYEAIRNLEGIMSIEGVDVACLGYMDLTVDMGLPGQTEHPLVVEAIQQIIDVASRNGMAPGLIHPSLSVIEKWVGCGMRFISFPSDANFLLQAASNAARDLRRILQPSVPVIAT